ncbi:hypothetical protein Pint_29606 [Pistacia integerrima]|uniref:Uncharacterized protein n=1 Tax=Pistacia integerrima TaxID=434235 RepID=A0ACC0X1T5_9ROSI|nr:hypothetical protein Pint_29606 [Pistacia integerrima]
MLFYIMIWFEQGLKAMPYATSSAATVRPSSAGLFSWLTGERSSSLPPLDTVLEGVSLPPVLPDYVETGKVEVTTLDNGIRIALATSANPAASIGIYLDCGSVYETPMSLEAIGGNISASASREQMGYTFDALKTYVPEMVELLLDCVRNPVFLDWEVNEEVTSKLESRQMIPIHWYLFGVVFMRSFPAKYSVFVTIFSAFIWLSKLKSELRELRNNPRRLLLEAIHSAGYAGALANPLLAPKLMLNRLDGTVLEEFIAENYTAPRIVLASSGVDLDELLPIAEPVLSDLPKVSCPVEPKSVYVGGDYQHTCCSCFWIDRWLAEREITHHFDCSSVLQMLMEGGGSFSAGGPGKGMHSRVCKLCLLLYCSLCLSILLFTA